MYAGYFVDLQCFGCIYICSMHNNVKYHLCISAEKRKLTMLASLTNVNKFYNGNQVLKNVSLSIDESDRIGLVGNNGCGKSTLLKILTGSVEPDRFTEKDGVISMAAKTTVGYLEQMGGLNTENTVIDEMRSVFAPIHRAIDRLREIELEIEIWHCLRRQLETRKACRYQGLRFVRQRR